MCVSLRLLIIDLEFVKQQRMDGSVTRKKPFCSKYDLVITACSEILIYDSVAFWRQMYLEKKLWTMSKVLIALLSERNLHYFSKNHI